MSKFKPGDKVKRKQNVESDHWWDMVCQKFKQNPSDVFTVEKIEPDESIQLVDLGTYEFMTQNFELAEQPNETKMISLKDNKIALVNLGVTIGAIEQLDKLIAHYSEDKPGPAYVSFQSALGSDDVQIDRKIMLVALKEQRQRLVDYMATLGIDANN